MAWKKLEIDIPDLKPDLLSGLVDKIKTLLETLVTVLEGILNFIGTITDPFAAALKLLIDQLKAVVETFLEDLGAYSLFVPIRKRLKTNFLGLGDVTPAWAGKLGIFEEATSPISYLDADLNQFLADANRYNGGNVGFFKTVIDSLYDEGDTNRPMFLDDEDYVGGVVMVMGTSFDPLGYLDDIWKLSSTFDGPDLTPKVPRPTGLQVRALHGISKGVFSTLLLWDPPEVPVWTLPDLGGIVLFPDRYAVIRGRNTVGALSAGSVVDLMGKRDLGVGDTFANGNMEVVHEGSYDITISSFLDENIKATDDDTFYYAVAWKLKGLGTGEANVEGAGTDIDYWYISNVARVTPFPTLPASTPPDWYRTPSIASLFPEFAAVLRRIVAQIEGFAQRLLGSADMLKDYVLFLKSEIDRYERIVSEILDAITRMNYKFTLPNTGVYTRTFKGRGGNNFFLADLAKSFLPGEPNRPPFSRGDEYVTGVVILTGGHEVVVDSLIAGLSWIFGGSSSDGTDATLEALGTAITAAEELQFGMNMQVTEEVAATIKFNEDMSTFTKCGSSSEEETPEFGKDLKVT